MELGSDEWYRELKKNYNFPCKVGFYMKEGKKDILSLGVSITSGLPKKIEMADGSEAILVKAKVLNMAEDYYITVKELEFRYG